MLQKLAHFMYWSVENDSLVIKISIITKLVQWFDNLWPACTRNVTLPLKTNFASIYEFEPMTSHTELYVPIRAWRSLTFVKQKIELEMLW